MRDLTRIKKAIDWYINCSESSMGISSGFYAMINSNSGSTPSTNPETIIYFLPKIRKHRAIHSKLAELPRTDYRKLTALYDDIYKDKYSLIIRNVFEEKVGLVFCMYNNFKKLESLCLKYRSKALNEKEELELNNLIALTNKEYDRLHLQLIGLK